MKLIGCYLTFIIFIVILFSLLKSDKEKQVICSNVGPTNIYIILKLS